MPATIDRRQADTDLAHDVCRSPRGSGGWQSPPLAGESADAYFARLVDEGPLEDAVRFAAVRLSARDSIWWGCLCVWDAVKRAGLAEDEPTTEAVDAAVAWVMRQDEEHRLAAHAASQAVGVKTPWGALAGAVFWSGGSVSLPGCPEVAPPPDVAATLVANAVLMAAAHPDAKTRRAHLMQSLRMAAEVHAGFVPEGAS